MINLLIRTCIFLLIEGLFIENAFGQFQTSPHIIVIMADDLGWNDVGFHGSNQIPTPNIDALGYNGIILNRHYVLPSCTPSRASFYTGKYPLRMGMQGGGIKGGEPRGIPLETPILPEHLRGLGYVTRLIGKWHVGYHTPQHTPLHRGFDSFLGFYNSYISYFDYRYSQGNMSGFDLHQGDIPSYGVQGEYATDLFTEEALRIIDHHDPQRPLYLQISHLAVHAPLEVPLDHFNNKEFAHIRESNRRKYAMMVSRLDDSLGRVVSSLGDKGMLQDSIILFLTDNGAASIGEFRNWGSNYPLRGTKYTLYEGGVRGTAVLWSPRLQKMAVVSEQLVHITDWLPTLYSAAGGNLKDLGNIDGVDQWPVLSEGRGYARDSIVLNIDEITKTEGAIHNRFKLVRGSVKRGYYDGYHGESGRNREVPLYNTTRILKSAVSGSISAHLGGPVTQPSAMISLRLQATVQCFANTTYYSYPIRNTFVTCNETECLFDIVNDPCETRNIAKQYPNRVQNLDKLLEKYGQLLQKQVRLPIQWMADPRRKNNTWEPWLTPNHVLYAYASAASKISIFACFTHVEEKENAFRGFYNFCTLGNLQFRINLTKWMTDGQLKMKEKVYRKFLKSGWNDLSFHGADQIPTPNIDALAYNGVILNRYYTQPTCTPSRTAFLSGRYPIRTGMQGFPLKAAEPRGIPLNVTLLPKYLKNLGYVTRLIGKWHTGYYTEGHTPANRGFDSFFGYYNGMIQYFNYTYTQDKKYVGYDLHEDLPNLLSAAIPKPRGYFTDILSQKAEDIISNHNPEIPLFLEISHLAAHCSNAADPLEVRDLNQLNSTFGYIRDFNRRKFAGMVEALDDSVGRTVAALEKSKMLENSIIVFVSDNGAQTEGFLENFGSNYPLRGLKFTVYEGGIRVPACIYSPLIKFQSRVSNFFMHVTDWLPTLYSAAGGNLTDLGLIDGIDQWSKIKKNEKGLRKFILVNIDEKQNTESAIFQKFKIVKGASDQYSKYYGDSGNNESYPEYNITRVLNSVVNLAINNVRDERISSKIVTNLRNLSRIQCAEFSHFPNCSGLCLFNIFNDPCETVDLSSANPLIVKFLERRLADYRKDLINQTNAPIDPAGLPEHFNYTWMPWKSKENI